jgi:hypothetical protein
VPAASAKARKAFPANLEMSAPGQGLNSRYYSDRSVAGPTMEMSGPRTELLLLEAGRTQASGNLKPDVVRS